MLTFCKHHWCKKTNLLSEVSKNHFESNRVEGTKKYANILTIMLFLPKYVSQIITAQMFGTVEMFFLCLEIIWFKDIRQTGSASAQRE